MWWRVRDGWVGVVQQGRAPLLLEMDNGEAVARIQGALNLQLG